MVSWKTYLLRATSRLETYDLMGAKLDIEEASKRLKNSDEKTGSNKKRIKKLKDKIDAAFEIKKPGKHPILEEMKEEDQIEETKHEDSQEEEADSCFNP